ncbi:hypothetical protein OQJ18_06240 [Fluoribacter dumoffii]|uniref:Uncharacterized protein n=1 Tax=Fluoribacter dumoffii TaxID=463 RepID=A0A377G9L9_9GAMM|nr:hypothetical protein [Fluoribacter dumoffii]KTC89960.1 hypothetical protein Ldum_1028 [Fluoribacter dumoffii NY 23]MCW8385258.1 hypothetical protein [Fluoribacter dumoffii]MCW8418312.1 hypothetical protein [Fluoribacter dumoffii]MCW8453846.1 hypothetical protein [Fluoribacter dumoffii]MCW8462083.1 hypothetical protein [Fluoribacter dumoffii]
MKRIAIIAATGFLALALTACGQENNKQPTAGTTDTTTTTQPAPSQPAETNQNQTQH